MVTTKKQQERAKAKLLQDSNIKPFNDPFSIPTEPLKQSKGTPSPSQEPNKAELKPTVNQGSDVGILRNAETGKLTGINIPGRPTLLNLPPSEVRSLAERAVSQRALPSGTIDQATKDRAVNQQQRGQEILEQNPSSIPIETPLNELNPSPSENPIVQQVSKAPIIGAALNVLGRLSGLTNNSEGVRRLHEAYNNAMLGNDQEAAETIKKELIKEMEIVKLERSRTIADNTNALIESIPLFGGALNKWAGSFIGTPGESVKTYKSTVTQETALAKDILKDIKNGVKDPVQGRIEIEEVYDRVEALDNKIEAAVRYSATLQANPESIDQIEIEILRQKNRIKAASLAAETALIGDYNAIDAYLDAETLLKE